MELTKQQLAKYNCKNDKKYIAVGGNIYDVSGKGDSFYGDGGAYSKLTGTDASYRLATMNMGEIEEEKDLTEEDNKSLNSWINFFEKKYKSIGTLKKD